jgi:hypothetical protein
MKNLKYYLLVFLLGFLFAGVKAQDNNDGSLGLPGDNLNLYAVMKLFQESETLEGFEKNLNDENSKINNLDLDGDGNIDYIKVQDNVDGDVHTIVLQVAITPHENQDIAVFTVQRDANNQVQIQLIGDEELYGKDYIIEPNYEGEASVTPNPGYTGSTQPVVVHRTTYVEIATWPVVRYIYTPSYVVWYSPWYYGYYPPYWRTWRPYYWHSYYGYHHNYDHYYYGNYRRGDHYRYAQWNDRYYNGRRSHSEVVYNRRQAGDYKNTYSRPDTRREGTEMYRKSHPEDRIRHDNRPAIRPGVNKSNNRTGVTRPGTRPNEARPRSAERPNISRPAARPGNNRSTARPSETRPATRPDVSRRTEKPVINNRPAKQVVNHPTSRQATTRPDSRPGNTNKSTRTTNSGTKTPNERRGR